MKIEYLANAIRESTYTVALVGLNMMREMGVYSYRDTEKAYSVEIEYGYSPEELFTASFFSTRPELFYDYYRNYVLAEDCEPGPGFAALAELERRGKLKCIVTKELYNFPKRAGCNHVLDLYGNIYEHNHCARCGKEVSIDYIKQAAGVPMCDKCRIPIHPGVRLLGEEIDNRMMSKAAEEVGKADLLLVLGMTMGSELTRRCIQYYQGGKVVVVNADEHYTDNLADLVYHENIENILPKAVDMI